MNVFTLPFQRNHPLLQIFMSCLTALLFSLIFVMSETDAHEGHHHDSEGQSGTAIRPWRCIDGKLYLGSFVACNADEVQIRLADSNLICLNLHNLSSLDRDWIKIKQQQIKHLNSMAEVQLVMQPPRSTNSTTPRPLIADHFKPFERTLRIHWDQDFLYVGSNGIPDHPMMVGIRSWQQQVPIPQKYFGENAWRIPLHPVPAKCRQ